MQRTEGQGVIAAMLASASYTVSKSRWGKVYTELMRTPLILGAMFEEKRRYQCCIGQVVPVNPLEPLIRNLWIGEVTSSVQCQDFNAKVKVCTKQNSTWDSVCDLKLARDKACSGEDADCISKYDLDYYGECQQEPLKGLVVGVYSENGTVELTKTGQDLIKPFEEAFQRRFDIVKEKIGKGKVHIFYGLSDEYSLVAVTGLGSRDQGYDDNEELDLGREAVRHSVASACRALVSKGCVKITVDPCGDGEAAAEASYLSTFNSQPLKSQNKAKTPVNVKVTVVEEDEEVTKAIRRGSFMGLGTTMARYFTDMPANHMTPTIFAKEATRRLEAVGVEVTTHDQAWAEEMKMGSFLSVAAGSDQPPKFLEITYNGAGEGEPPVALVGKGITFDTGGIELKKLSSMMRMRGDKAGGAVVVAVIYTLASLNQQLRGLRLPRLILADALLYAQSFKPKLIMDFATLTGGAVKATGPTATSVFTTQRDLFEKLRKAGSRTGDRVWRMPLWKFYSDRMVKDCELADICNSADSPQSHLDAAAFLKEFVKTDAWLHLDIAPVALGVTVVEEDEEVTKAIRRGSFMGLGTTMARYFTDMPANHMTPTIFAKEATRRLEAVGVEVTTHDQAWAEEMKMGSFLSVAAGSDQPPKFLEITYNGAGEGEPPVALVGKGITFDTGGIELKKLSSMMRMRGDKAGGAVVVAVIYTLASLNVPLNVKGFIPLTENMPSGKATKPTDVVYAMDGTSIVVNAPDAEGRLILADALLYAQSFKPKLIMDFATLTGGAVKATGPTATSVFTTQRDLFEKLRKAGSRTGDRVWRMPLWKFYTDRMVKDCELADLCNSADSLQGHLDAAAFLKEFVKTDAWLHLDIAPVALRGDSNPPSYLKGSCGRPVRTVVEFLTDLSKTKG
ncbi:unnamed protein product [Cyprideis torosa]|uniref:Cytosol aminopeptidase domain-containing protein n=1 Tax=Cyprideis torosa TaxID=163714 RepID=A0A7R8ZM55_9CRUS|nr:unnamed protein product [Cyprideis torosa]CAG0885079.1 unnamed protein product [Cyprideis torosa]